MSNFLSKNKVGIIIILMILMGIFIYGYFFKNTPTQTTVQPLVGEEVLNNLDTLRNLTIDDALLKTEAFQNLQDYTTQVVSQPRGRMNPFAPLGVQ